MKVYQNRKKRLLFFILSIFITILFLGIAVFMLSILLGWIDTSQSANLFIANRSPILIIPILLFSFIGCLAVFITISHGRFINIREPILKITNLGCTCFTLSEGTKYIPWKNVKYALNKQVGKNAKILVLMGEQEKQLAVISLQLLQNKPEEIMNELRKYVSVADK